MGECAQALRKTLYSRSKSVGWLPDTIMSSSAGRADGSGNPFVFKTGDRIAGYRMGLGGSPGIRSRLQAGPSSTSTPGSKRATLKSYVSTESTATDASGGSSGVGRRRASLATMPSMLEDNRSIFKLAKEGDVQGMRALLDSAGGSSQCVNILEETEDQFTALHYAARYDHLDMVRLLVEYGANVQTKGEDKLTALHLAARCHKPKSQRQYSNETPNDSIVESENQRETDETDDDIFDSTLSISNINEKDDLASPSPSPTPLTPPPTKHTKRNMRERILRQISYMPSDSEDSDSNNNNTGSPKLRARIPHRLRGILTAPKSVDNDDDSAFSSATSPNAFTSVILYLASHGAELNVKDQYGLTPLHHAAMRGNNVATRDLLLCRGINLEAIDAEYLTPLQLAANHGKAEVVRLLINAGADIRCHDVNLVNPVHRAATDGNLNIVKMFLEAVEYRENMTSVLQKIEEKTADQSTALHLAIERGHRDVVEYLVSKGADVNTPRENHTYPLHLAATVGDVKMVKVLLTSHDGIDRTNSNQETALHLAAQFNHSPVIDFLVTNGANIEKRNKENMTPLLMAASHGHEEAIDSLLRHGADINAVDKDDKTAIYLAAQNDKHDAVVALLKQTGASELLMKTDRFGNTPLHVSATKGFLGITHWLLDMGTQIDSKNDDEHTPLHLAAQNGRLKIVKDMLRRNKQIINAEDAEVNTPLHLTALAGHDFVIKELLEAGANVAARNSHLWTALDCAALKGHIESVRILLEAGSPIEPQEKKKSTPLHLAASTGNVDIVMLLLAYGADIKRKDDNDMNCLELAIENAQKEVARSIIYSQYWMEALECETFNEDGVKNTPLRMLIKRMPDVAEDVFNRCTETNGLPSEHAQYAVTLRYHLLDDTYITLDGQDSETSSRGGSVTDDSFKIRIGSSEKDVLKKQFDSVILKENHPLMIMVRLRRHRLLEHPLCITLLHFKWNSFGRYVYYTNLLFYLLFVVFLTAYVLTIPAPYVKQNNPEADAQATPAPGSSALPTDLPSTLMLFTQSASVRRRRALSRTISRPTTAATSTVPTLPTTIPTTTAAPSTCEYPADEVPDFDESLFAQVGKYIIIFLVAFHLTKELFQLYMLRLNYFGIENLMEWSCYIMSLILVLDFTECSYETGVRERWQWQVGTIAIFLTWVNLVLFIKKFPYLGLYVVMFTDVLTTFCKVCVVFFFFLIAFAFGFHTVLYYEEAFESAAKSIVRTMVMMLGEFQFDDLFKDSLLEYPAPAYFLFSTFLVLVNLITMNLLVGLAVDDIKTVQAQANIKRIAMQVELVLNVESVLPRMLQERFVIRERSMSPNRRARTFFRKLFTQIDNKQALSEALLTPEKNDIERIEELQDLLVTKSLQMERVVVGLERENAKLQNMLTMLMRHQGMRWEEEDVITGAAVAVSTA